MIPHLLLVHGWGFSTNFWTPLRRALGEDIDCTVWDLGYHGAPVFPEPSDSVVAVGHSFGLLWLLHRQAWRAVVSINGFTRFTQSDTFLQGVPVRLLDRMRARLVKAPDSVYRDFMARCGYTPTSTVDLDTVRLAEGLAALAEWDVRPLRVNWALAGRNDPIVTPAMTEASFAGCPIEWHDGGHLLPLTAPEWCAIRLRSIVESL